MVHGRPKKQVKAAYDGAPANVVLLARDSKLGRKKGRAASRRPWQNVAFDDYFLVFFLPKLVSTASPMLASICLAGSAYCPVG